MGIFGYNLDKYGYTQGGEVIKAEGLTVPAEIVQIIAEIDEFKGAWSARSPQHNRPLVPTQSAYMEVFKNYSRIGVTENVLKHLHTMLFENSTNDKKTIGEYKKFPNPVEGYDEKGRSLGVIFEPVSPIEVPINIQELLSWTRGMFSDNTLHPLLTIGIFIVMFLTIQPFQDGNGQLVWLLVTLFLLKAGYLYTAYFAIEGIVDENKESFYLALRKTQNTLKAERPDWFAWLTFFLHMLQQQKRLLEKEVTIKQVDKIYLPQLSTDILELLQAESKLTIADIVLQTKANRNTVKKHLERLVKESYLNRHGKGKGTWYTVK
jgi:Fic family protein